MSTEPMTPEIVSRDEADADAIARAWLRDVYQGDKMPQLTVRAVITGMLIGGIMSISNLYVGLKTGWGLGVTITACIIAYAVFNVLQQIIPAYRTRHFTILENYTMSSAASAAGYMSSSGLVSAIPALLFIDEQIELEGWQIMVWIGSLSLLGVFMAIPLKRQLINIDQLPFPTGIATAETLRSMHSSGAEAMSKAKSLLAGAMLGAAVAFWKQGLLPLATWLVNSFRDAQAAWDGSGLKEYILPDEFPLFPGMTGRSWLERLTLGFEGSLIMVGAGAIMGIRVGVSLLIGAIVYYGIIGNYIIEEKIIAGGGYRNIVSWTLWPATAMMVTSGLLAFALRWRTVIRAFSGLTAIFGRRGGSDDPLADIEVPGSWFVAGTLTTGAMCVILGHYLFNITWAMGILAVAMTFVLSIVAARATGETDITPIGAMGKITQLTYGVIAPGDKVINLMTASITAGAASHSADLLSDLKSGYLLGGNPRKQTISQLFGVLAGTLICVPVYLAVAQKDKLLGTAEKAPEFAAPAARVWAGVAELLAKGVDALPRGALEAMLVGGAIGIVLTLLEEYTPREYRKWIPSATGLGIAGVIPAWNAVSMFIGALAAWILAKAAPTTAEKYTISVSSGLIAGETLMAVAIIFIMEGPGLLRQLTG